MAIITRATLSDAQQIRVLEKHAHGEDVTSRYDAAMVVQFGYAYVAKEKGRMVGAITAWPTRNGDVKVNDWVVHPKYRRKGIGEQLYQKLLHDVPGKTVIALVDTGNIPSLKAHQKLGFKIVKEIKDAYGLGKGERQVLMRLENNGG